MQKSTRNILFFYYFWNFPSIGFTRHYTIRWITVRDPKVSHFFEKKTWKSGTLWEHLHKKYYFWTIIKQKKGQKWDTLGCETLGSWTLSSRFSLKNRSYLKDSIVVWASWEPKKWRLSGVIQYY